MCGIAGHFLRSTPAKSTGPLLLEALAHRGPDGAGLHEAGTVLLAHTRLSIIDLNTGAQPLFNEDRSLALVANGEIYNHVELRQELTDLGHRFATGSDCEVLLHAYEEYGNGLLDKVRGMFAFALHDLRADKVLLGRDRLGIKPLFMRSTSGGVWFASELKALYRALGRPEINPIALGRIMQCGFSSGHEILAAGYERVLPGELVWIGPIGIESRTSYWKPNLPALRGTFEETLDAFDELMAQIMVEHCRSDVPFGLFLSGGVDSSALLALLAHHQDAPLQTFSVGFPDSSVHDELDAAASIARRFDAQHTALRLTEADLLRQLPLSVWAADELMGDYANLPVLALAEQAGKQLKVVFSGEGGDEVFAGYGRYRTPTALRWLRSLASPGSGGFRTRGILAGLPQLCGPDLNQSLSAWRQPFVDAWAAAPRQDQSLARMQWVDMATWLPDDLLVKADRMLMAWALEGRVPFLDHRVIEFGLALPAEWKIHRRTGKVFLRSWAERRLPKEHLWSRKKGFTVPVRDWMRGPLMDVLEQRLPANPAVRAWFSPAGLRILFERQRKTGAHADALWLLLQLALWHRLFVEGDGQRPNPQLDLLEML
ncbi:MAG TPA: asparagine synthase (glutamine-hydrolyzing) [Thiobacillaceae bacterium]|nr:asparagine synthase (glutamine-hydrolyzing) [Thiobacillaceae bacterium]